MLIGRNVTSDHLVVVALASLGLGNVNLASLKIVNGVDGSQESVSEQVHRSITQCNTEKTDRGGVLRADDAGLDAELSKRNLDLLVSKGESGIGSLGSVRTQESVETPTLGIELDARFSNHINKRIVALALEECDGSSRVENDVTVRDKLGVTNLTRTLDGKVAVVLDGELLEVTLESTSVNRTEGDLGGGLVAGLTKGHAIDLSLCDAIVHQLLGERRVVVWVGTNTEDGAEATIVHVVGRNTELELVNLGGSDSRSVGVVLSVGVTLTVLEVESAAEILGGRGLSGS